MKFDLILRVGTKLMLPFILIFAPYVHFHGDYGPGGGFQAGVIIAAAFILYAMVFGLDAAKRIAPQSVIDRLLPVGVLIFAAAGLPAIVSGQGRFLDFGVYGQDFLHAHEWGILIVETGVIVTVASTMLAIFYAFADRGRQ
jgi:multicomponent Na+:H+ antiporter subunit B